jgi:hypothetical protein
MFTGDSSPHQEFHKKRIERGNKGYKKVATAREIDAVVSVKILL